MAKTILVTQMTPTGVNSFTATGSCNDRNFLAKTIIYRGEPVSILDSKLINSLS